MATRNFLLRLADAVPDEGLPFEDIQRLMAKMHDPEQHWWKWCWTMDWRRDLRAAVAAGLLRFVDGRYVRPRKLRVLPLPPLKLPTDTIDPQWPERMARNR
jgi:hypothetical protein